MLIVDSQSWLNLDPEFLQNFSRTDGNQRNHDGDGRNIHTIECEIEFAKVIRLVGSSVCSYLADSIRGDRLVLGIIPTPG
jgi:hypothetical protein